MSPPRWDRLPDSATVARTSRRRAARTQRWRCKADGCTEPPFTTWAAAERHADTTGHGRLEQILEDPT